MNSKTVDIIMEIVEQEENDTPEIKIKDKEKLTISEIHEIEDIHWYYKYRNKMLKKLLSMNINGNKNKIANIGFGTGTLSKYVEKFGDVTHLDISPENILFARENFNINPLYCELPWILPLDDYSYDYIIMLNIIELIDNDFWTLDNLNRKLKPNGKLIISTLSNPALYCLNDKVYGVKRRYNKGDFVKMLKDTGFKVKYFTYYETFPCLERSFKILKDKLFEEETVYLSYIPENNDKIYSVARVDLDTINTKKSFPIGNQMFFVCSKMNSKEKNMYINGKEKEDGIVKKILSKLQNK